MNDNDRKIEEKIEIVKNHLKSISSLLPGQTLSSNDMSVVNNRSLASSLMRRWYGEDRNKTIERISSLIDEACNFSLIEEMEKSIEGLNHLKMTYSTDQSIIKKIDEIIDKTKKKKEEGKIEITGIIDDP